MEAILDNYNDKRNAAITSLITLVIIYILLYFITLERSNPPIGAIISTNEIPLEQIIDETPKPKENGGQSGGGGGQSQNDKVDPTPKPQTDKVVTNTHGETAHESKGESNKTTAYNSKNEATSVKKSNNPFGNGGDGAGEGGGVGKGKGLGFGNDNGPSKGSGNGTGDGDGNGNGKPRIRKVDPKVDDIVSDANYKIQLRVKINSDGNVIDAKSTGLSTTTDQRLIKKVIAATISQAKYNEKPGAGIEEAFITLIIHAK